MQSAHRDPAHAPIPAHQPTRSPSPAPPASSSPSPAAKKARAGSVDRDQLSRAAADAALAAGPPVPAVPTGPLPAAASTAVRARLFWTTGGPAETLVLRPAAAALVDALAAVVGDAVALPHASTSALLLGPRGTGKTAVVERVLASVRQRLGCPPPPPAGRPPPLGAPPPRLGVVRLSGLVHAEERVAFREAARQLCGQMGLPFERTASHDENLDFFGVVLSKLAASGRAAVFVLDEVDAFARRPRQALLYNLVDKAAAAGVRAALLGVSARVDCVDLLEKRVRSRFSGRVHYLPRPGGAAAAAAAGSADAAPAGEGAVVWPPDPDSGEAVLRESLRLPDSLAQSPSDAKQWNAAVDAALADAGARSALAAADDAGLLTAGDAATAAAHVAAAAALADRLPTAGDVMAAVGALRARQAPLAQRVARLSVLEVYILACLHRCPMTTTSPSFDAAFTVYAALGAGGFGPDAARGRGAAWAAFQRLACAGLVTPAEGRAGAAPPLSAAAAHALRPHSRVEARPTRAEVVSGARAHRLGLGALATWLDRDGAVNTRGGAAD
jgi:origin recognition complex subunit 4